MNLQPHQSGRISGTVPNQAGTHLSGHPQQNGHSLPVQMQNSSMHHTIPNVGPAERRFIQDKILESLMQRRPPSQQVSHTKIIDLVKRLEGILYKISRSKEEYLNMATLESRVQRLIKLSNNKQQFQHGSSSPSVGTMIPTPGMQQPGGSNLIETSSLDGSIATNNNSRTISSTLSSGGFMPTRTGFSWSGNAFSSDGALASEYAQSSGSNNMPFVGAHRTTSQMIPTPGLVNSYSNDVNHNFSSQSFVNVEAASDFGALPAVEPTILSQEMRQNQFDGGQNSRILHNLGDPTGASIRSSFQQKSYGLPNQPSDERLGMMGNKISLTNGLGISEGYLTGTSYGNSSNTMHQHLDQHQQTAMQSDMYGTAALDALGSGDLCASATYSGSMMNSQSLNAISIESIKETNSPLMSNQSKYFVRENLVQPQQLQQSPHQFQRRQLLQHLAHNQRLLKSDTSSPSHLSSEIVSMANSGPGIDQHAEGFQSQASSPFLIPGTQSQFPQNSMGDHSLSTELHSRYGQHDVCSSVNHSPDQGQQSLHLKCGAANRQNDVSGLSGPTQTSAALHGLSLSKSHEVQSGRYPHIQNVKDEFHHKLTGEDVAQRNKLSSEESIIGHSAASRSAGPSNGRNSVCRSNNLNRAQQFKNQQRWLLFLRHARGCSEGKCREPHCLTVQKLLKHMDGCKEQCSYPRCASSKNLIYHYRRCKDASCPVCVPVKIFIQAHKKPFTCPNPISGSCKANDTVEITGKSTPKMSPETATSLEDLQPSIKRIKIEHGSQTLACKNEGSAAGLVSVVRESPPREAPGVEKQLDTHIPTEHEITVEKMKVSGSTGESSPMIVEVTKGDTGHTCIQKAEGESVVSINASGFGELKVIKVESETGQGKTEDMSVPSESVSKSGKPEIKGVSMTELFTPEQVREHVRGLRQWIGQSKAKAEKNQAMENSMNTDCCQLCAVAKLMFEPPPIYCTQCGARVKRNATYYTIGTETRHFCCNLCYTEARGDTVSIDGTSLPKARMEKKKNDEETEESWVQCDKCEAWQHQICALFNGKRNDGGLAEYTCPNCYIEEVQRGERRPLPQSAVLGAKDLPRTILSDHMEQRLFAKLKQERQERAKFQGKSYDEVPGAESLVVRVVSSVDKKLEVKPRFLDFFQEENYPVEFPYKSKVVLLFQKIEGVEVCLFGMYVQEFGSECQQPNNRRVYLSYLDSVKYFRPEVRTVTGEALRTFVYHELLIGYLEYCKKRGFASCYIWACPPLKGEDYILYCHPEIQKTPKSDKLREWYLSMLRKAKKENIVVDLTNLYDHFFVSTGECKAKITAARLPYFDGDYWPGAAEDMIFQLQQEEDGRKQHKKGNLRKTITKRALKASGQVDPYGNASKDLMLMHKLGETISPMKEDFIMVHLHHACVHCCVLMVSGNRWVCKQCKNFQLCDKCFDAEGKQEDRERHPKNQRDKHTLYAVEISSLPDTKDKDEILESEFFDTRQAFLSLCQGNRYQYDTLRRAKHSSMMVLYHLHNPTAPAFVATCNICHQDIETGQGWRCETCPEYDVCNACYRKDGGVNHPHKLTNNPSNDREQNKEAREFRFAQLRKMLDLLVHASQCRSAHCQYPNCRKVKGLFRHGMICKVRVPGGCLLCKKMWYLLTLHSRACKESKCKVPRCRDLQDHVRRMKQQSESRRRAAVDEMMRQRMAEVASSSRRPQL